MKDKMGSNKREFYVVQFTISNDYVCVPKSWLILPSNLHHLADCVPHDMLVFVAYPKDEDQIVTKDLVKRKESYNEKWNKHTAVIRYGSDSYDDAESWIVEEFERNYYKLKSIVTDKRQKLSEQVKKPDQTNNMSQANSSRYTTDASMTAAKPSPAAEQSTHPNQYNYQEHIPDRSSLSNFLPKNVSARSLADNHNVRVDEVCSSHNLSTSLPIQKPVEIRHTFHEMNERIGNMILTHTGSSRYQTASLMRIEGISQENVPRNNFERSNVLPAMDLGNVLQSVINVTGTSQQLPSLSHEPPSYVRRSDGHQNSVGHKQHFTHSHQNQSLPTEQDNFQQELRRESSEGNTGNHRAISQTTTMRISSIRRNSTHHLNPTYQTPELAHESQMQSNQRPQKPKIGIHKSIKPKDKKQKPNLQRVTTKTLPSFRKNLQNSTQKALSTTYNNFLLNNPQLQIIMCSRSTGDNNVQKTCDRQNTEMPSRSVYQSSRTQQTNAITHENEDQNLCPKELLVEQSRPARSAIGCQTDECVVKETRSPHHAVTSGSNAETNYTIEISDHEMSADESPVETTNNVSSNINDSGCGSVDKSTAAHNFTSTNHQTDPQVVLEQQMLDNVAIQMHNMTDTYSTTGCLILDDAEKYKKLQSNAIKKLNSAQNSVGNASLSNNVTPEVPPSSTERHNEVPASVSSSTKKQHGNNFAKKMPNEKHKKTKCTVKHRTNLSGLIELMPHSGIYMTYERLKYCQQFSKSLARKLYKFSTK